MTQYRDRDAPDPIKERKRIEAIHNAYPDAYGMPSRFNASGLVPYPCLHGIPVKPARFAATKGGTVWRDEAGNERPPYGGQSFGRSKYLTRLRAGTKNGMAFAVATCAICDGLPVGDDFYVAADGSSLR